MNASEPNDPTPPPVSAERETEPGADAMMMVAAVEEEKKPLDFADRLDFFGGLVHPGETFHRAFSFSKDCRIRGLRLPRGLKAIRIALRIGPRFRCVHESRPPAFEGEDARVFDQVASVESAIASGGWKRIRLVAEASAAVHLVVRNETDDDLRADGSWLLDEDLVPAPEHEEI